MNYQFYILLFHLLKCLLICNHSLNQQNKCTFSEQCWLMYMHSILHPLVSVTIDGLEKTKCMPPFWKKWLKGSWIQGQMEIRVKIPLGSNFLVSNNTRHMDVYTFSGNFSCNLELCIRLCVLQICFNGSPTHQKQIGGALKQNRFEGNLFISSIYSANLLINLGSTLCMNIFL